MEAKETGLQELTAWKKVQVNKLDLTRKLLEESKAQVEVLKKILKHKEGEITEAKGLLRQAKEDAVQEYHDSNALLKELGGSFVNGFDNCFRQVKASFSDLNLSHISIDAQAQTPAQLVYFEGIGKLFADETNPNPQADKGATYADQEKSVRDGTRQLEGDQTSKKNEDPPISQQ